jgi:type IV pilus assembly protein PilM
MGLIPTTLGTRPRLAVEIRPEGVVAARAQDAQALVSAVAQGTPAGGVLAPGLKVEAATPEAVRRETIAAVKKALEAVALRERQTTLVLPDAAVRVLLLEFDQMPSKAAEALAVVRFRLKKLLPFDADDAVVSYQVMSTSRNMVRVLAVAVPKEVLAEYEGMVREAGFEPGAVLPSTLAACAGLTEIEAATLVVNAGENSVTTAIVQGGVLLLHRTVDLALDELMEAEMEEVAPTVAEAARVEVALVDVESTAGEWAKQEPLNGYGVLDDHHIERAETDEAQRRADAISAEFTQIFNDDSAVPDEARERVADDDSVSREEMLPALPTTVSGWNARRLAAAGREITQALSVAAAYFEDTLQMAPGMVLCAGTIGAETLGQLLREAGFGDAEMHVREMVEPAMLTGGAVSTRVPRGWMAGVRGALRG